MVVLFCVFFLCSVSFLSLCSCNALYARDMYNVDMPRYHMIVIPTSCLCFCKMTLRIILC